MFNEKKKPKKFPCRLATKDNKVFTISSEDHYNYLNEKANKLYQVVHGYKSQPEFDYFCSNHPQEINCFTTALIIDDWSYNHPFNEQE